MAKRKIKKGDDLLVKAELEFTGTIHNFVVSVEQQHIPMVGSGSKWSGNETIKADADPIDFIVVCFGEVGSVLNKHDLTINSKTFKGHKDVKFKNKQLEITIPIPYHIFDLEEEQFQAPGNTLVANIIVGQTDTQNAELKQ